MRYANHFSLPLFPYPRLYALCKEAQAWHLAPLCFQNVGCTISVRWQRWWQKTKNHTLLNRASIISASKLAVLRRTDLTCPRSVRCSGKVIVRWFFVHFFLFRFVICPEIYTERRDRLPSDLKGTACVRATVNNNNNNNKSRVCGYSQPGCARMAQNETEQR